MNLNPYPLRPHGAVPIGPLNPFGAQEFVKGFVLTACLSALQDAPPLRDKAVARRVLRRALQGGVALSAADRAARSAARGDYSQALVSASLGAAGVYLFERLLRDAAGQASTKE